MTSQWTAVLPTLSEPVINTTSNPELSPVSSAESSAAASEDDMPGTSNRLSRPKLGSRKSSGSMIVSREYTATAGDDELQEGDVRTMSPRRNSEEVDRLGEEARRDLIEQAKTLQTSLQAIVDRVETVKVEHQKLEGGNKFLQS